MSSFKSKVVIFGIQHSHLFKGKLKRDVITRETDTAALRRQFEEGAKSLAPSRPGWRSRRW